jgi:hypothetical protein
MKATLEFDLDKSSEHIEFMRAKDGYKIFQALFRLVYPDENAPEFVRTKEYDEWVAKVLREWKLADFTETRFSEYLRGRHD